MPRRSSLTPAMIAEMQELLRREHSYCSIARIIAKRYGVKICDDTVHYWLDEGYRESKRAANAAIYRKRIGNGINARRRRKGESQEAA